VAAVSSRQRSETTATAQRRQTREEERKDSVRTASKQPSNALWLILLLWTAGIILWLLATWYILNKHQNKQSV